MLKLRIDEPLIRITITNEQSALRIDRRRLAAAVRAALKGENIRQARISLAVLEQSDGDLEGEIVVSAQRAAAESGRYGWGPDEELLLYVVHGALHLAGLRDARPADRRAMRRREKECLAGLGIEIVAKTAKQGGRPR